MTYILRDPFGATEEVATLEQLGKKMAEFVCVSDYALRNLDPASSTDDRVDETIQMIAENWNLNVPVATEMESDPELLRAQDLSENRRTIEKIRSMAKTYCEKYYVPPE